MVQCVKFEKEMEALEKDEEFMRRVEITKAILEMNLIERHDNAMEIQLAQGKTGATQWKLERINPSRWGNKPKEVEDIPRVVIVEIPGLEDIVREGREARDAAMAPDSTAEETEDADNDD